MNKLLAVVIVLTSHMVMSAPHMTTASGRDIQNPVAEDDLSEAEVADLLKSLVYQVDILTKVQESQQIVLDVSVQPAVKRQAADIRNLKNKLKRKSREGRLLGLQIQSLNGNLTIQKNLLDQQKLQNEKREEQIKKLIRSVPFKICEHANRAYPGMTSGIYTLLSEGKLLEANCIFADDVDEDGLKPKSCDDIKKLTPDAVSGVFTIWIGGSATEVYCEVDANGTMWTVFQKRFDGSTGFGGNFNEYSVGFGSVEAEHWMGLDKLHKLTNEGYWKLHVDMEDFNGNVKFADYEIFAVGESPGYKLMVSSYSGTAGDELSYNNGASFTTPDRDQDAWPEENCADHKWGSWWHRECSGVNLNGVKYRRVGSRQTSIHWENYPEPLTPLKRTTMMVARSD